MTYAGAEVPYEVEISDSYTKGSMITSYTMTYGAESGRDYSSRLACQELPVAKALDRETDSGYTRQYWNKHANGGDGGYRTLRITSGPAGYNTPGFEEVEVD